MPQSSLEASHTKFKSLRIKQFFSKPCIAKISAKHFSSSKREIPLKRIHLIIIPEALEQRVFSVDSREVLSAYNY